MSGEANRGAREFRLDDELWQFRRDRSRRITRWALGLLAISVASLTLGILFWGTTVLRNAFLVVFFVGFLASCVPLVARYEGPVRLNLTPQGIDLRWRNGKKRELGFKSGMKIGLYDATPLPPSTTFTSRFGKGTQPRGDLLLLYGHSLRKEPFDLTKGAFDAIRRELLARGATILRDGPVSPGSTATLTEFRLPDS